MTPVMTIVHADRKCSDRPHPVCPVRTNGSGRSSSEGIPTVPTSPQYSRGWASRIATPLTTSAAKLAADVQWVRRTRREWRRFTLLGSRFSVRVQVRFRVPGSGFRVQVHGSGFALPGSRFRVRGVRFTVLRLAVRQGWDLDVRGARMFEPRTANPEPRTSNLELRTEPEHEPRTEHPEV